MEEAGIARWLAAEARTRGPAEAAELAADAERGRELRAAFRTLIATTRERLAALYASNASDDEKRAGKAAAFAAMRAEYEALKGGVERQPRLRALVRGRREQRRHRAVSLYADRVPQFAALLAAEDGDLRAVLRARQGAGGAAQGRARARPDRCGAAVEGAGGGRRSIAIRLFCRAKRR